MRMAGVESGGKTTGVHECGGCGKRIGDRYLLKAVDLFWHEDCLKCGCCDCRLGEVGSTLYKKANLLLCKRDYLRLFGTTGHCAACNKVIPAFEMVMRAKTNVYHLECFACQQCNHRFCVGDRFYLCDNKILCEYDYEERMVFANMSYSTDSLAHIKRQVSDLQQPQEDNGMIPRPGGGPPPTSLLAPNSSQAQQITGLNGVSLSGGSMVTGPGTSGILPGEPMGAPIGAGDPAMGPSSDKGPGQPPNGSTANHMDDGASSGYGSPDSLTLEDR
ncbi:unnamed protein product, partial [Meganyctiphanes norvegica]